MTSKILEVSENSLKKAQQYTIEGNYGRAFAHYLVYLELQPNKRDTVESDFIDVLTQWIDILKCSKSYDNCYKSLQNALQYYPNNYRIFTISARFYLKLNQHENALNCLTQALNINKYFLPALKLMNYIKNISMARWHIRMLNDSSRNQAFQQAIEKKLAEGYQNVLDIGTGTGLFSMFAAQSKHGVKCITACDYSSVMFNLAQKILAKNACDTVVNLIHTKSTKLTISNRYPIKANLLVAEIFDSGVFGEHVLPTLIHAWENLIEPYPRGQIIPHSVELHIVGVQSMELAKRHRVCCDEIHNLSMEFVRIVNGDNKPYDTEDFLCFKNSKYLTKLFNPWLVDFTNINQIKTILNGDIFHLDLDVCFTGEIDAFLLWFKLNLDDDISIDNCPRVENRNCCWEQAIFYLDESIRVTSGDIVPISFIYKDDLLKIMPPQNDNRENNSNLFNVSGSCVRFLNDFECLEAISNAASYLRKKFENHDELNILDMAPFPYLGLLLLKDKRQGSLKCYVKSDDEKLLILKVCYDNNIIADVIFIDNPMEYKNEKFDVIFVNVLDLEGELNQDIMLHIPMLYCMLKSNGVLFPSHVTLHAQLVQSDWFKRVSQVDDRNVCNFQIAEFIQKYEVDEELDFTLEHVECIELTKPIQLIQINFDKSIMEEIIHDVNVVIKECGQANAICYWFEINYFNYKHNTGPKNKYSYVNNAAFLLKPSVVLNKNDQITLRIINYGGLLKIFLLNTD